MENWVNLLDGEQQEILNAGIIIIIIAIVWAHC